MGQKHQVSSGSEVVGVSTSRCYSYFFREMLSLCVIDREFAAFGTEVVVTWGRPGSRQKPIRATVARAPYKVDRRRSDVTNLQPDATLKS
jgi:vanillate/3-O-methylgallate O-demethylase